MSNTFYWHDYETFGLRGDERRPSQFAGVRTDENLNFIGEGEVLYCRPNRDFLPSPESCLLTRHIPQYCEENGLPENEFARAVFAGFPNRTPLVSATTICRLMTRFPASFSGGISFLRTRGSIPRAAAAGICIRSRWRSGRCGLRGLSGRSERTGFRSLKRSAF